MGRKKGRGKRKNETWTNRNALDMQNERFEKYYKAQGIIPGEEWDAFMHALRQPLPSTFRIAGHRQMKTVLGDAMRNTYIPELEKARLDGEPVPVPRPIPWYPEQLAWHVGIARKELRKSPEYKRFHSFLVYETEVGNISRQEAVSMIPPLFLDVKPHHRVIDLCAAPGSKTSQLLEAMDPPTGILIANDSDHKRAYLLVHTSARLSSPALMVTNLDASIFPSIKLENGPLRFDRILADVPCSGDGTLRKNLGIWRSWSPMEGNGLHSLQIRILQRAMRLLAKGSDDDRARIVYSTCSLNPVENEAVVAAALNTIPGFEIVDVAEHYPGLIRRPGLITWRPAVNRDVDMPFETYEDYCKSFEKQQDPEAPAKEGDSEENDKQKSGGKVYDQGRKRLLETHWPPHNADSLGLERCMRVYPHLQDTGGFFVAVIERKKGAILESIPEDKTKSERKRSANREGSVLQTNDPSVGDSDDVRIPKRAKLELSSENTPGENASETISKTEEVSIEQDDVQLEDVVADSSFKENPFTFIAEDDPNLVSCIERLHLSDAFPRSNIYVRNPKGDPVRSLYLINDLVKSVMSQTDYTKIRLISAGVKLFGRSELAGGRRNPDDQPGLSKNHFRVLNEGLSAALPYIDQSTFLEGDTRVLRIVLKDYYPLCGSFAEPFKSAIEARPVGSHVACFKAGDYGGTSLTHDLILPLWKSEMSVSLMIDKKAKSALSLRLFGEDITYVGRQILLANAEAEAEKSANIGTEDVENNDVQDVMDEDTVAVDNEES